MAGDDLVVLSVKWERSGTILDDDPSRHLRPGQGLSANVLDGWVLPTLSRTNLVTSTAWQTSPSVPVVKYLIAPPHLACMGTSVMLMEATNVDTLRLFDSTTNTWTQPAPRPARSFVVKLVWNGTELFVLPTEVDAGKSVQAYNPATNTWRSIGTVSFPPAQGVWTGSRLVGYVATFGGADATVFSYEPR